MISSKSPWLFALKFIKFLVDRFQHGRRQAAQCPQRPRRHDHVRLCRRCRCCGQDGKYLGLGPLGAGRFQWCYLRKNWKWSIYTWWFLYEDVFLQLCYEIPEGQTVKHVFWWKCSEIPIVFAGSTAFNPMVFESTIVTRKNLRLLQGHGNIWQHHHPCEFVLTFLQCKWNLFGGFFHGHHCLPAHL